jgi:hypothetical protein
MVTTAWATVPIPKTPTTIFEWPTAQLKRPTVRSRWSRGKETYAAKMTGAAFATKMKETFAVKVTGVDSCISERGIVTMAATVAKTKEVLRFTVRRISPWPQMGGKLLEHGSLRQKRP